MLQAQELFAPGCLQDPYPLYDRLRAGAPVQQVDDAPFFVVSTFQSVVEATARPEDFSSNLTATMTYQPGGTVNTFAMEGPGGSTHVLATADDPAHAAHRKLVLPRMAARRISELEPFIAATAQDLLNEAGERFDWMDAVADRLPMLVVARLLGLPATDVDKLVRWAYASTQLLDGLIADDELTAAAIAATELAGYLIDRFEEAAEHPGEDLLGDLASHCAARRLPRDTAVFMLTQLVGAGAESTASLLGSAAGILAQRPDMVTRLREEPELIPAFIEEVLRYESPFRGHYRHVLADTTLADVALPAGSHLLLLWGAANRDPAAFDEPDTFRLDRVNTKSHLAFGKGAHFCVGAVLARLEARIVLSQLLTRANVIQPAGSAEWLPSLLVRRLRRLPLTLQ
ncbi:cytochrome P450 [Mycolicibacterium sp.]|uniref:cytochrome P450 n=1 Tax=Mycolicibacterium sp. TaxID=2320850 RepID=UPI0037C8F85F